MDLGGAMLGFVLLGELLGGEEVRPALLAIGAVLVATLVLTRVLVRETAMPSFTPPARSFSLSSFQFNLEEYRAFGWLGLHGRHERVHLRALVAVLAEPVDIGATGVRVELGHRTAQHP